ncbi:hypothetical protein LCL95_10295 [Bacillus timonensis]|nr:hypothetical protein [Bacillus timonensis]
MKSMKILLAVFVLLGNLFLYSSMPQASTESVEQVETDSTVEDTSSEQSVNHTEEEKTQQEETVETETVVTEETEAVKESEKQTVKIASFTSTDKYFKAPTNEVAVYVNKNGQLEIVSYLVEGQEYQRVSDFGNWHQIQFGTEYGYVWKADTEPSNGSSIQNLDQNSIVIGSIKTTKDLSVFDNTSGSLVAFATLKEGISYPIIAQTGNWYKVVVAGRYGYIYGGDVVKFFSPSDKYFQVKSEDTAVFVKKDGEYVQVGTLVNNEEYKRESESGDYHVIRFGSETAYVEKNKTVPSSGTNLRKPYQDFNPKGSFVTLSEITVYDNSTGALLPFANVNQDVVVPLLKVEGNWLQVGVAGRIGYVYKPSVKITSLDVVNPKQIYSYTQMQADIATLQEYYPDLIHTEIIGQSVDGRNLYALKLGNGEHEIFINGSHHAREHMTTNIIMEMIDQYAQSHANGTNFNGYNTREILAQTSIWFVPMVNPDGVTLVQSGHTTAKNPQFLLDLNNGSTNFSSWKANIRGVDLNRQYPADWANIKHDPGKPASQNFKGYSPLSEPEALAIYNFTKAHNFRAAVAYHSSGQILYWHFNTAKELYNRDYALASKIGTITGYSLVQPTENPSGGGFTDWFIQDMKQPGFTPEISPPTYSAPVPLENYDSIWEENKTIGLMLAQEAKNLVMVGWKKIDSNWYYFNQSGKIVTGWLQDGAHWYYLQSNGVMKTGWLKAGGKWYYFNSNGTMRSGWLRYNSKWYYLTEKGDMALGWKEVDGKWYYFYSDGKMAANTTINGYKVGADGAWIR